jgi:hypothetical protein
MKLQRALSIFAASIFIGAMSAQSAAAQSAAPKLTEEQAHAIGVDAYVYLYPLITMDITRKQLSNTDKGFGRGPMNAFSNVPAYPPASDKSVVRTNYDTLYSLAYLDMLRRRRFDPLRILRQLELVDNPVTQIGPPARWCHEEVSGLRAGGAPAG